MFYQKCRSDVLLQRCLPRMMARMTEGATLPSPTLTKT